MKWYVGTSGWGYANWRGKFYPRDLPAREWLSWYGRHFNAVEINNSFYHLPSRQQFESWDNLVPKSFTFTVKASRFITHQKRLKDPERPLKLLMKSLAGQKKAAPLLFQLPPHFKKDLDRLETLLNILPGRRRYAIEFRDPDWHHEEVYKLLRRHKVAFCLFEKDALRSPRIVTANFVYVRLHGRKEGYKGNYSRPALASWRRWLSAQDKDVYIFFDNTAQKMYALENAVMFKEMTDM